MSKIPGAVLAFVVVALAGAIGQSASVHDRIATHVKANAAGWIELRRDLHRHPELSGQEQRTAGIVAAQLKSLGLEVQTGVGGHGVVGVLMGGRRGPLVAYRADMDAVRSTLPDPAAFPSTVPGVRHICGHDVHVAVGLGLASALASVRRDLPGRVMFIFQPAEERATGARAMLDAGLFAKEKPVAIFGVHASPLEVGTFTSKAGQMMFANQVAPGVTNDAALYATSRDELVAVIGQAAFTELQQPPAGFSEDFGEFQKMTPGVFFFIGLSNTAKGLRAMPHSADFNADDAGIGHAVRAMAAVVVARLNR
jgi:metal-dependent amidase/aminoacylase/carboxypeptidase family protein